MAKKSAAVPQPDVLVLGCHPSAFFAVALLKQIPGMKVVHAGIEEEKFSDRLVMVNPKLFELHSLLGEAKAELVLTPTYGLRFLADDRSTENQYASEQVTAYVGSFKQIQSVLQKQAGLSVEPAPALEIHGVDETGVDLTLGKNRFRTSLVLLAGELPREQKQMLGMPDKWESEVIRRYSYIKCKAAKLEVAAEAKPGDAKSAEAKPTVPMSLDLGGTLHWAWMVSAGGSVQLSVEESGGETKPAVQTLQKWADVLAAHRILKSTTLDESAVTSMQLPLAGALAQDMVGNRTILLGPAGGFYSACAEEIYPSCWSAIFAVAAAKAALKEKFVQDALQQHRQKWGATLGDYLRGPQQNLRFLLPLVYRNPTMAARLAEAILHGESVVR